MNPEEVAYHEAGHAVVHVKLRVPPKKATIRPQGDAAGHVAIRRSKSLLAAREHYDPRRRARWVPAGTQ